MKLWCCECQEAVEPIEQTEYDIPNAEVGGYEKINLYYCPNCMNEVYHDPVTCSICGELTHYEREICFNCTDIIRENIAEMARTLDITPDNMRHGVEAYINMEV